MATKNRAERDIAALTGVVRDVLGSHPEDVMGISATASDVFDWLEIIFRKIEDEAESGRNASVLEIRKMAAMGRHMAADFSNYMDCAREKMTDSLESAGYEISSVKAV